MRCPTRMYLRANNCVVDRYVSTYNTRNWYVYCFINLLNAMYRRRCNFLIITTYTRRLKSYLVSTVIFTIFLFLFFCALCRYVYNTYTIIIIRGAASNQLGFFFFFLFFSRLTGATESALQYCNIRSIVFTRITLICYSHYYRHTHAPSEPVGQRLFIVIIMHFYYDRGALFTIHFRRGVKFPRAHARINANNDVLQIALVV